MSIRVDSSSWIPGAIVVGQRGLGVLAENIPSTGDAGPSFLFNDLSLPADNGKEICGRITTWPSSGTLTAYEDTSFEFTAADGAYSFQYQLYVDGVATGSPATVSLYLGSVPVTITASLGTATASGLSATLSSVFNLAANRGTATASGYGASIVATGPVTITCAMGVATASGHQSTIYLNTGNLADAASRYTVTAAARALSVAATSKNYQVTK